ncbi:MAG: Imm26 family immunity protein [Vicingaceae bacterium]|nr:MAG: Imm26 family immunity protein [Vicingaceae bacterium]
MAKRFNLNIGDVFTIPLGNNQFGFGQVVTPYDKRSGGFMIAIFNYKSDDLSTVAINEICLKEIIFLGFTFDAKIYHKDWTLIGNYTTNIENIIMPYYRLGTPPEDIYMVNHKGECIKKIDEKTFHKLNYKIEIAPMRYENALKAYYGLQEWKEDDYDKLLYKHSIKSNNVFESVMTAH